MAMEPVPDRDPSDRGQVTAGQGRRTAIRHIRTVVGEQVPVGERAAASEQVPAGAAAPVARQRQSPADGQREHSQGGRTSGIWHPRLPGRKPPKLVRGPGVTVHGQIEDWLADAIATGRLAPGDRLPTEQDLAAWLGVSRMTLRHALAELAQRGLVTRTVGRSGGTFVAEPKVEQDLTVLAGFSEQLRRHGLVAGARVLAAAEITASPAASAALEISVGAAVYEVRRLRLAGGQPILIEHSLFPADAALACSATGSTGRCTSCSTRSTASARTGPRRASSRSAPVSARPRRSESQRAPR